MTAIFTEQAARFATRREDHAKTQANVDRTIHELRTASAVLAVQFIDLGYPEAAADIMTDCLLQQMEIAKIRHLEVVR